MLAGVVAFAAGLVVQPGAAQAETAFRVRGTVICPNGKIVVGVTVQSTSGGGGPATVSRYPGAGVVARFSRIFPTNLPSTVFLDVGCGGTESAWASTNRTPSTSVPAGTILYLNTTCNGTGSCTYFPLENNTPAAPTTNPVQNTSQATWRAAEYWHLMTSRYPNWSGNAGAWDDNAKATGWTVESWPRVNSLFVAQPATGQPTGHVGYVADVRLHDGLLQLRVYDRNADLHGTDRNGAWINFSSSMRFIVPPNRAGAVL